MIVPAIFPSFKMNPFGVPVTPAADPSLLESLTASVYLLLSKHLSKIELSKLSSFAKDFNLSSAKFPLFSPP